MAVYVFMETGFADQVIIFMKFKKYSIKIIYQYTNGHLIKSTNYGEHEIKIKSPFYAVYIG